MFRSPLCGAAALALVLSCTPAFSYSPPPGYQASGSLFGGSAFAVSPGGRVAIATDNLAGGGVVSVYADLASVGGAPLNTFTDPTWKFFGGLDFAGEDTIVIGENGDRDTVFTGTVSGGAVAALAPTGSVPALADVTVVGSDVLAVAATGLGTDVLLRIPLAGGSPSNVVGSYTVGYGGGVAAFGGKYYLLDTNDPFFLGNAGIVRVYDGSFAPIASINLSIGGGSGAYDIEFDHAGMAYITTGTTITRLNSQTLEVSPFGTFTGQFPFPTFLDFTGAGFSSPGDTGRLFVNGVFTEVGGVFAISVPEPATLGWIVAAICVSARARRGGVR